MKMSLAFGPRRQRCLLAASIIAVASLALMACSGGQDVTRASSSPMASVFSNLGKMAYVLDGSIYVKSLPDGEATRLAVGTTPRWSPSGEWLLFSFDGDCVMRADGSDRRCLSGHDAAWSPVEDRFAYYRGPAVQSTSTSLLVESPDGSITREVSLLAMPWSGPKWSPDGKRLVYSQEGARPCSADPNDGDANSPRLSSLCTVDANAEDAGTSPIDLYDSTSNGLVAAGWTADSQYVLFWQDPEFANSAMNDGLPLDSIPASGGQPRKLTSSLVSGVWEPSPEGGSTILMTEGLSRATWTSQRLVLADAATGEITYLTGEDTASQQPDYSLDGTRIVFVSQPDRGMGPGGSGLELEKLAADRRIWVMDRDGGDQRQLTDDPAYRDEAPLWSADGSQILFVRMDEQFFASLWLVNSDGSGLRQVVDKVGSSSDGLQGYYANVGWAGRLDWWQPSMAERATPQPTAEATRTPATSSFRHTGIEGVDAVIDATLSSDVVTLHSLVGFTRVACSTTSLHGTPCNAGEADGTLVDAFPVDSVLGIYYRSDNIDAFLQSLTSYRLSLYGVYLAPPDFWPPGDYVAVFSSDVPGTSVVGEELVIKDGRLVGMESQDGLPPEQLVQLQRLGTAILPPP